MQLALKVDVDTLRGTRAGVSRLTAALRAAGAHATFLFSLGPDHTGRALRRVLRPGFFRKVARTSVLAHYGARTLMYGTLLPGPDIARRAADCMRGAVEAGFEVGVHCFDHTLWQDFVAQRDAQWARRQMQLAIGRFREVFGTEPKVHGAAGWQVNAAVPALEEQLGFTCASDARGRGPFLPWIEDPHGGNGRAGRCPQLPTTLPTLDELIGLAGVGAEDVHEVLLARTRPGARHASEDTQCGGSAVRIDGGEEACSRDPVFTLHAELEGMRLLPVLERLLEGWQRQGYALVSLRTMLGSLDASRLPCCRVSSGTVPGRSGTLAMQGPRIALSTGAPHAR